MAKNSGINRTISIPQPNIFGRIGTGVGKGLADQLPQEIERGRLASGLKELSQQEGLTPFQQFSGLASVPGITPQMIQSGSELLRQQARSQQLIQEANRKGRPQNPYKEQAPTGQAPEGKNAPSLTTRTPIEATLNPYIPKSFEELQQRAGQLLEEKPGLYSQNPELAMNAAVQEDQQEQARNLALQGQRANEEAVQTKVQQNLQAQKDRLGAVLPGKVYSEIEDKAINAVRPKNQGGEGLTEQEASRKYGKELDNISRAYESLKTVGSLKLLSTNSSKGNKDTIKSIRNDFKERDDLENFADTVTAENRLSPSKAYYLAYPVSEQKELNNGIVKTPDLKHKTKFNYSKGYPAPEKEMSEEEIKKRTLDVAEKLSPLLGREGSPLSVAEELQAKGYDPYVWMDYLDKNRKKLNLGERQGRELDKPRNFTPTINDQWLFYFSGLDKIVEQ